MHRSGDTGAKLSRAWRTRGLRVASGYVLNGTVALSDGLVQAVEIFAMICESHVCRVYYERTLVRRPQIVVYARAWPVFGVL